MKKSYIAALLSSSVYLIPKKQGHKSISMGLGINVELKVINVNGRNIYVLDKKDSDDIYHTNLIIIKESFVKSHQKNRAKLRFIFSDFIKASHPFIIVEGNPDLKRNPDTKNIDYSVYTMLVRKSEKFIKYEDRYVELDIAKIPLGNYKLECRNHPNMGATLTII